MQEPRRFFNQSQPQTLQMAVMLLYINGVFKVLGGWVLFLPGLALIVALFAGAYGIANEQKWGYQVAVGAAVANLVLPIAFEGVNEVLDNFGLLLSLMFDIALLALLLHPQSREYQKIWFR